MNTYKKEWFPESNLSQETTRIKLNKKYLKNNKNLLKIADNHRFPLCCNEEQSVRL